MTPSKFDQNILRIKNTVDQLLGRNPDGNNEGMKGSGNKPQDGRRPEEYPQPLDQSLPVKSVDRRISVVKGAGNKPHDGPKPGGPQLLDQSLPVKSVDRRISVVKGAGNKPHDGSKPGGPQLPRYMRPTMSFKYLTKREDPKTPVRSASIRKVDPKNPPHYMKDTISSKIMSETQQNKVKTQQSRAISKDNPPSFAGDTKASKAWREAGEQAKQEIARQQEEEERELNEKVRKWGKRHEIVNQMMK